MDSSVRASGYQPKVQVNAAARKKIEEALAAGMLLMFRGYAKRAAEVISGERATFADGPSISKTLESRIAQVAKDGAQKVQDGVNEKINQAIANLQPGQSKEDAIAQAMSDIKDYNAKTLYPFYESFAKHQALLYAYRTTPDPDNPAQTAAEGTLWNWKQNTDFEDDCTEAEAASPDTLDNLIQIAGDSPPVHRNCQCNLFPENDLIPAEMPSAESLLPMPEEDALKIEDVTTPALDEIGAGEPVHTGLLNQYIEANVFNPEQLLPILEDAAQQGLVYDAKTSDFVPAQTLKGKSPYEGYDKNQLQHALGQWVQNLADASKYPGVASDIFDSYYSWITKIYQAADEKGFELDSPLMPVAQTVEKAAVKSLDDAMEGYHSTGMMTDLGPVIKILKQAAEEGKIWDIGSSRFIEASGSTFDDWSVDALKSLLSSHLELLATTDNMGARDVFYNEIGKAYRALLAKGKDLDSLPVSAVEKIAIDQAKEKAIEPAIKPLTEVPSENAAQHFQQHLEGAYANGKIDVAEATSVLEQAAREGLLWSEGKFLNAPEMILLKDSVGNLKASWKSWAKELRLTAVASDDFKRNFAYGQLSKIYQALISKGESTDLKLPPLRVVKKGEPVALGKSLAPEGPSTDWWAVKTEDDSWLEKLNSNDFQGEDRAGTVRQISAGTGLEGSRVDDFISGWAGSSRAPTSLAMQLAVKDRFELPEHDWFDGSLLGKKVPYWVEGHVPDAEELANFVYDSTQKVLEEAGKDYITVYRGVGWNSFSEIPDEMLSVEAKAFSPDWEEHPIDLQPLSSWTTDSKVANSFAHSYEYGYVMAMRVPRNRIFSFAKTGPGTGYEDEVLVIGGDDLPVKSAKADTFGWRH